jgi:hypothetical protein
LLLKIARSLKRFKNSKENLELEKMNGIGLDLEIDDMLEKVFESILNIQDLKACLHEFSC